MNLLAPYNFGFRVSSETVAHRYGRFKTPAGSGGVLRKGSAVAIDEADAERLEVAAAATTPRTGAHGLLWQEDDHIYDLYDLPWRDSDQIVYTKADTRAILVCGAGTKVWMKNVDERTASDGTVYPAVEMFDPTSVAVRELLTWNGTLWVRTASDNPWMIVTAYDAENEYLEATLLA
jgi:hypothetical protein